jgi:hypothetical protein
MAKPPAPKPSKAQQAVAVNKAAQQQRTQRVAKTTQKISQIQSKSRNVKPTGPTGPATLPTPTGTTGTTGVTGTVFDEDAQDRLDSIAFLQYMFDQYGLGSLANKIVELKQQGLSDRVVTIKLQETPEYKQRFIGNENRRKAGLQPLTPAEYISAEAAYKKVMRDSELPSGFYDQADDFAKFIGNDVSPAELQQRVDIANQSIQNADPFYTDSLRRFYGLQSGDMLAYALDPERALPFITRQQKAAQIGAEAARQGMNIGVATAESLRNLGVSQEQARTGFESVAQIVPIAQKLSQITAGEERFGAEQATTAVFGGESSADYKKRLQRLADIEQSRFAGQAGIGQPSLGRSTQGQF